MFRAILLLLSLTAAVAASPLCPPQSLVIEYEPAPLGLDVATPRLSWVLCTSGSTRGVEQYAYAIEVTNTDTNATAWSSGMVVSSKMTNVRYNSSALPADSAFSWRVQWWSDADTVSPWSLYSSFTTGLYTEADWKNASWV